GVIQPVQHVNGTGRRCGKADAEPTGKFGVAGSCHPGCFFVPHVNAADAIGMSTIASTKPLMPSPGNPNMTSTPQSIRLSTRTSDAVMATPQSRDAEAFSGVSKHKSARREYSFSAS